MPGVVCCVFADDIPGSNATGPIAYDETVLAHHQVCFCLSDQSGDSVKFTTRFMMCSSSLQVTCVGHIIGAVVADTQLQAQRAAKAVRIQYEELQPVVTIQVRPVTPVNDTCVNIERKNMMILHKAKQILCPIYSGSAAYVHQFSFIDLLILLLIFVFLISTTGQQAVASCSAVLLCCCCSTSS